MGVFRKPAPKCAQAALLAAALLAGGAASALTVDLPLPPQPMHKIVYMNLLTGRYNPIGGEDRLDLEYRLRLIDSRSKLLNDTYLGLGFTPAFNPVMTRIGATLTIKPVAVASLAAAYNYVIWHGALGHVQAFESPDDDTSDTALDRSRERAFRTTGHELALRATLAVKLGPVALSSVGELSYARMDLEGKGSYYYTPRFDALVANPGWLVTNDTDLVYITDFGLVIGARNSLVHAFDATRGGEGKDNTPTDRLGPLLAFVFFDHPRRAFNKPTILLVVNWWLAHRYRTGEDVPQAVPYVVLGFKFEGELWASSD